MNNSLLSPLYNGNIQSEIGVVNSPLISMNIPPNIPNNTNPLDAFVSDSNIMMNNTTENNMDLNMQNVERVEINKPETPKLPSQPGSNKSKFILFPNCPNNCPPPRRENKGKKFKKSPPPPQKKIFFVVLGTT